MLLNSVIHRHHHLWRRLGQFGFFALFILAPPLDIFRLDLDLGHFIVFGYDWTLGLDRYLQADSLQQDSPDPMAAGVQIFLRVLIPLLVMVIGGGLIFWRYGRIYCGWLCPHFSIVEHINRLMQRMLGKPSVWESAQSASRGWRAWLVLVPVAAILSVIWSVSLLSYLVDPFAIYFSIFEWLGISADFGEQATGVGFGSTLFLVIATVIFTLEFLFARHLFCKYGCAIGLVQALLWMGNSNSLEIRFDRSRARLCQSCDKDCDQSCPMRLPTRSIKRARFACTQCGECVAACREVQKSNPDGTLLDWHWPGHIKQEDADKGLEAVRIVGPAEKL